MMATPNRIPVAIPDKPWQVSRLRSRDHDRTDRGSWRRDTRRDVEWTARPIRRGSWLEPDIRRVPRRGVSGAVAERGCVRVRPGRHTGGDRLEGPDRHRLDPVG